MIFMALPDQLLSGKKVTNSKRRKTVIERFWLSMGISSLVITIFFGWVAVKQSWVSCARGRYTEDCT
jgi:hypothetical protein